MALHTRGNQPSKQRDLNAVGNLYTTPTTNEDVVEIGDYFEPSRHDVGIGGTLTGYFRRCAQEVASSVKESFNPIVLLKDHFTSVATVPTIQDMDNNTYTYVTIGSQQWLVENYKGTTYGDGTPITHLPEEGIDNLVTTFTNGPSRLWDTFTVSGSNITSAIEAPGTFADSYSNSFSLSAGDVLNVQYELILNSGTKPRISLYQDGIFFASSTTSEGIRSVTFDIYSDGTYSIGLDSEITGCDCSFNFINVFVRGWQHDTVGAYCAYDNNNSNVSVYGLLYNWFAIDNARGFVDNQFTSNGVPSTGWRVPSAADWDTLANYLGGYGATAGGILKEAGTTHWTTPNLGAIDIVGFSALPGGLRNSVGVFSTLGDYGYYISSDSLSTTNNSSVYFYYNTDNLTPAVSVDKNYGMSVRIMRDI